MFSETRYAPYPSTRFTLSGNTLSVASPWLDLEVEVDDDTAGLLCKPDGLGWLGDARVQQFLAFLKEFPLLNVAPRRMLEPRAPLRAAPDNAALSPRPGELVAAMRARLGIAYENQALLGDVYEWNLDEVLEFCRIPGEEQLYDPYAAYTFIRGRRLQYQFEQMSQSSVVVAYLDALRRANEGAFFEAVIDVMSQQFYVTRQCTACLHPALENDDIRAAVEAYIAEEQNHDRLILSSIQAVSDRRVEDLFFAPGIMVETELIRYAASVCPLSFACLVSIMEGSAYPEHDPVGELLRKTSRPQAAKGIEAHFQINKTHNHTAIPETFVVCLPPVDRDTVASALRMTEVAIKLDAEMPKVIHRRFVDRFGEPAAPQGRASLA